MIVIEAMTCQYGRGLPLNKEETFETNKKLEIDDHLIYVKRVFI